MNAMMNPSFMNGIHQQRGDALARSARRRGLFSGFSRGRRSGPAGPLNGHGQVVLFPGQSTQAAVEQASARVA